MSNSSISQKLRKFVTQRAQACCEYCLSQEQFSTQAFSIDHIIPIEKGGETVEDNLALSCQGCNNHKYTKIEDYDALSNRIVALYHPRIQQWQEHFVWNADWTLIIGITPTGRATVDSLCLNRRGVVNLRRVLARVNQHPPS